MQIKIINVDVESVVNGNKNYELAEVLYDFQGNKRTQKVVSFANPSVFKTVKNAQKGEFYEVTVTKNGQGYNQWTAISASDGSAPAGNERASGTAPASSAGSNTAVRTYETAEERERRQRLIVRQSSLTAALATLTPGAKAALDPAAVQKLAEQYTDWVFEKVDLFNQPNDLPDVGF